MPKKIAIDWDASELRLVVGRTSSTGVTITDVAVVPIEDSGEPSLAALLRKTLDAKGLGKVPTLVTIGRGKAELRQLQLPPVPDEELPDMIRFQAIRDFAAAGEKAIIDFVPVRSDAEGVEVVAAAVSPEQIASIEKITGEGNPVAERIVLRPLAAAALYAKHQDTAGDVVLVDLLADDADIVILRNGKPVFVRSVRLPENDTGRRAALAGEVRRSVMASNSGGENSSQRRIVIWGRKADHLEDIQQLSERIGLTVETIDPLTLVSADPAVHKSASSHVGRLAPLIGLLDLDEGGSPLLIDFRNPRKPPEVQSQRGRYLLYGTAAAVAAVLVGFSGWWSLRARDQKISQLQQQLTDLKTNVDDAQVVIERAERIDTFLDGNVIWLEELKRVAETIPPADDLILTSVDANLPQRRGAELTLSGKVTQPKVLDTMLSSLQDEQHRVLGSGINQESSQDEYGWVFSGTKVVIEPEVVRAMRDEKRYLAELNATAPENAAPADTAPADAAPEDAAPEDAAPADAAPEDAAPEDTAPEDTAPEDTAPEDTAPADTAPEDAAPADTAPADTAPEDAAPADTAPEDAAPADTAPEDAAPADTAPEDAVDADDLAAITLSQETRQ